MKIGYQGIEGSNSYKAALEFINDMKFDNAKLISLVDSYKVAKNIDDNNIDYGVMAYKNSTIGEVKETLDVLKKYNLIQVSRKNIAIHHYLFKKKNTDINNINKVASHEQALKQTENTINKIFKKVKTIKIGDTALAAKMLSQGKLSSDTAVICSKEAGKMYNLDCIKSNIENDKLNTTEFILVKK